LLKAIKILINDPVRARYPYASVTKAVTRFLTCRQLENESLTHYMKHFKGNKDSLAQNMGKGFLKDFDKISNGTGRQQANPHDKSAQTGPPKLGSKSVSVTQ
jgi:hypothetical protein